MSHPLFIERKKEQERYQELLREASPWVLTITGLGVSGKSTLLSRLREQTPSDFCVVKHDFAVQTRPKKSNSSAHDPLPIDPLTILEEFADQARNQCDLSEYKTFKETVLWSRTQLAEQRTRMIIQNVHVGNEAVLEGGSFSIDVDENNKTARKTDAYQRDMVASAFYRVMDTFTASGLVILLDTCEWLNEQLNQDVGPWLIDVFAPRVRDGLLQIQKKVYLVAASSVQLEMNTISEREVTEIELDRLDEGAVKQYFENIGMDEKDLRDQIYKMTYGNAACVSIVARLWQDLKEKPESLTELPAFRRKFNEYALRKFIEKHILDGRLKAPFDEIARYGVLLRSFTKPLLKEVFSEHQELQNTNKDSNKYFTQFITHFYIKKLGNYRYAFLDLLREILADAIRQQEPEKWERYHQRALKYFQISSKSLQEMPSTDWHYHSIACELTYDEEQNISYWLKMLEEAKVQNESLSRLLDAFRDKTLLLTSVAHAIQKFEREHC